MNIILLCGSLSYAGAQRQLFELSKGLNKSNNVIVCSISSNVPLLDKYLENNVKVEVLGLRKRHFIRVLKKLMAIVKDQDVEVVYSFLETANTYNRILKLLQPNLKIVSSERNSDNVPSIRKKVFEYFFSERTNLFIANSYAGKEDLFKKYNIKNTVVIPNGVNSRRFDNLDTEDGLRMEFPDKLIIGMIARIKPQKNYEMFLKVANVICRKFPNVVFLAIGDQPNPKDAYQDKIITQWEMLEFKERICFLGARSNIPEILSNTDISILTSHREGCSNTVLESMFSGCPLVLTNVGDNYSMVSERNKKYITEPMNINEMVNKLSQLIEDPSLREIIGDSNKRKAYETFTLQKMVDNTENVLSKLLNDQLEL